MNPLLAGGSTPERSRESIVCSSSASQSVETVLPKAKLPFPTISNKEANTTPFSRYLELQSRCPCSSCEPACVRTRPAVAKMMECSRLHVTLRLTVHCSITHRAEHIPHSLPSAPPSRRSVQPNRTTAEHISRMQPAENSSLRHPQPQHILRMFGARRCV